MNGCWLCGRPAPGGVCAGPHADYQLRGPLGATSLAVELPEWWPVRPVAEPAADEGAGVTASGAGWRIRYDEVARLKRQQEAERAARADERRVRELHREREEELAEMHRLAEKFGMVVRPKLGSSTAWTRVEHRMAPVAPRAPGGGEPLVLEQGPPTTTQARRDPWRRY